MDEQMHILLCEDDENLGMLLREYLQAKGFDTELCQDGDAGFRSFMKGKFDICVLDVMMPKKDGKGNTPDKRGNTYHLPHSQNAEGRHTQRFQNRWRRLHNKALLYGGARVPH